MDEHRCGHDKAQQVNSSRSYEPSVDHRDAMAARHACAGMFVSRVYARPGIGWAWTICLACADTTKEVKAAAWWQPAAIGRWSNRHVTPTAVVL